MEPGAAYQAAQAQVGGSGGLGKTTSRGHQGALVVAPRHERAQLHRESQDLLADHQRLYGQASWAMQAAMQAAAAGWLARVTSKGSDANAPGASVPMPPTPPQRHHTYTWEWAGEGRGTEDGVRERGSRRSAREAAGRRGRGAESDARAKRTQACQSWTRVAVPAGRVVPHIAVTAAPAPAAFDGGTCAGPCVAARRRGWVR